MSANPTAYPIVIRIVDGFIEASQPDLKIYRVRGRFDDIKRGAEIGAIVLDIWNEVIALAKSGQIAEIAPSGPTAALIPLAPESVRVGRAAEILGVCDETIRRMCRAGKLDAFQTPGGHWKVKMRDPIVQGFLNNRQNH